MTLNFALNCQKKRETDFGSLTLALAYQLARACPIVHVWANGAQAIKLGPLKGLKRPNPALFGRLDPNCSGQDFLHRSRGKAYLRLVILNPQT